MHPCILVKCIYVYMLSTYTCTHIQSYTCKHTDINMDTQIFMRLCNTVCIVRSFTQIRFIHIDTDIFFFTTLVQLDIVGSLYRTF